MFSGLTKGEAFLIWKVMTMFPFTNPKTGLANAKTITGGPASQWYKKKIIDQHVYMSLK